MSPGSTFKIGRTQINLGQTRDLTLKVSESYSGAPIVLPVRVIRGPRPGPVLFVSGAIHGDELNGTGIVRDLILHHSPVLKRGTLVLIPVVNILGFERHSRYMPDRRDLNRSFPGSRTGSLTARLAYAVFHDIVMQCEWGIDLHSAANFRNNFPNVRAAMNDPRVRELALAFGCEVIINGIGPQSSLRAAATRAGCATIVLEAGETWKIEADVVAAGVRGIKNVLVHLGMTRGTPIEPTFQAVADKTVWIRATEAGLLHFHVKAGDIIKVDQPIAMNTSLLGKHFSVLRAPVGGIVLGMTTLPAVKPGDPVCHIALVDGEKE